MRIGDDFDTVERQFLLGISTFPHHVHLSPERVAPSEPMTIVKILAFLEEEFQRDE